MKILAADTSTKVISAALVEDSRIKVSINQKHSMSQGSSLITIIKNLLAKVNCDIKDIELFCVGLGPGSFTGLRVSVATMRSLSIALKKPIIGISSFDAIAYNFTQYAIRNTQYANICVLFDAKQDKVYARFYKQKNNSIEPVTDFLLKSVEDILNQIKEPTVIAGDAVEIYNKRILETKPEKAACAQEELWYPKAEILAKLAQEKYDKGYKDDPFKLLPLYIYPKECQIKNQKPKIKN